MYSFPSLYEMLEFEETWVELIWCGNFNDHGWVSTYVRATILVWSKVLNLECPRISYCSDLQWAILSVVFFSTFNQFIFSCIAYLNVS